MFAAFCFLSYGSVSLVLGLQRTFTFCYHAAFLTFPSTFECLGSESWVSQGHPNDGLPPTSERVNPFQRFSCWFVVFICRSHFWVMASRPFQLPYCSCVCVALRIRGGGSKSTAFGGARQLQQVSAQEAPELS